MANKRDLKKEINYLTDQLLDECVCNQLCNEAGTPQKSEELITRIVDLRNNLIARISHPDSKDDPKQVKKYYKKIIEDFDQAIDDIFKELGEETTTE